MKRKCVLFDLDGTLLPMDTEAFVKFYLGTMAKKLAPLGYDPKALTQGIWEGTEVMVRNDGSVTNEEAFWRCFCARFGSHARDDEPHFEEYYRTDFQQVQAACGYEPQARQVIDKCKALGMRVILATNPLFPAIATQRRIRWAGLNLEDFELVTTYENSHFCKPNPAYYKEILDKQGLDPRECLMVGNDVTEDMVARELGMEVFLLTPCLLNKYNRDISSYPQGGFPELLAFLENQG